MLFQFFFGIIHSKWLTHEKYFSMMLFFSVDSGISSMIDSGWSYIRYSFMRYSNFAILESPIWWKRNTFYWINWDVNREQYSNEIWPVYIILQKKFYKKCGLETSSGPLCIFKELSKTSIGKWYFWNKLIILNM